MRFSSIFTAATAAILVAGHITDAFGQAAVVTATYTNGGTSSWNDGTNWDSNPLYPSGVGAGAIFNGATSAGTRTVSLVEAITVGSISVNSDTATSTAIGASGGSLTFDAVDAGPATIVVNGTGTGNFTIGQTGNHPTTTLTDDLIITINQTSATSQSGALNWTGPIGGTGGVTRDGAAAGTLTFGTSGKTYTGPTIFNGGRTRISVAGRPSATSSMTINPNAHVEPITDGNYTFGPGTLFLNGTGIANNGAIRPNRDADVGRKITITNPVELLSTSSIHSQTQNGSTNPGDGRITLTGVVSGVGGLQLSAPSHDQHLGTYHLTAANTYSGGTELFGGRLIVGDLAAGFPNATLGTGNVTVYNAVAPFGTLVNDEARSQLTIPTGVLDAISDIATLRIAGGFTTFSVQQSGFAELQAGIDETVGSLILGATPFTTPGTYGAPGSGADFTFAEYFSGTGVIRIEASPGGDGDYNDDGVVDAADYVVWRKDPAANGGDPVGYDTWRENFAEPSAGSGGNSGGVPEPATLVLLGLCAPLALVGRRNRT